MEVLVTGAAGFIGSHVARRLLERGDTVAGVDNLNTYYDPTLKRARLAELAPFPAFRFQELDLAADGALEAALADTGVHRVVHLAAQAGVRYGLKDPRSYIRSNVAGHLNVLEFCRGRGLERLVYASSSSVYGSGAHPPFAEGDVTDRPSSLYAATKKADEMMSAVYADLHGLPQIGLRFFSVYGPWGRPDMAYWLFTEAMLNGRPIPVFNHGEMWRDFTYIDDIAAGVLAALDASAPFPGAAPHRLYNIGNNRPVRLLDMIRILEEATGRRATLDLRPMQPGEMRATAANIDAIGADLGFAPTTRLEDGLPRFVDWFRRYHGI
jgi:UDP-glucuronate 4-epimerase